MRAIANFFYTLSWRLPGRTWRRLLAFAEAEAESALELRCAAALTDSPERAALYLRHAEDEARHAQILVRRAEIERGRPVGLLRRAHAHLFRTLGEAAFIAYVFRGERRGRRQFEAHVAFFEKRDPALSKALDNILADERRHERYTLELLHEFEGFPALLRRAAWKDRGHRWRRAGAGITTPLFDVLMTLVYLLSAPLALFAPRSTTGWQTDDDAKTRR